MTQIAQDYPEYDRRQADADMELMERLRDILRQATYRRLTEDEVRWLCVGCGIDIRDVA